MSTVPLTCWFVPRERMPPLCLSLTALSTEAVISRHDDARARVCVFMCVCVCVCVCSCVCVCVCVKVLFEALRQCCSTSHYSHKCDNFQTPHTYTHFYTFGCIPSFNPGIWIPTPEPTPGSADPLNLAMAYQSP